MDIETRMELIGKVGEEIITKEELKKLLETKAHPIAYDGFEPSGLAHLPFGVFRPLLLEDMLKAGVKFKLFLADWHAMINNKMGGDIDKIKKVGKYFIEVWKAADVDMGKVEIIWANEIMTNEYWGRVFKIGENTTLSRTRRALSIMGRKESELSETSQLFYPMMQVADIFQLDVDICQLGLDQRRANIMAREIAQKLGWKIPVAVHHHMLMGLQGIKQEDIKISFEDAKKWLKTAENEIRNLSERLEKIDTQKHFARTVNVDRILLDVRKYDVKLKWPKNLADLNYMFEGNPRALNSFIITEIPVIVNNIKELERPLKEAISKGQRILADEWKDWISKYDKLAPEIQAELCKKAQKVLAEGKEMEFDSKMSKSKPSSAIFVHDSEKEIREKISKAFCKPKEVENNPMLDYSKHLIFRKFSVMKIKRTEKFGGDIEFESYKKLEESFRKGELHPADMKTAVSFYINEMIKPIREHFEKNKNAKELYDFVRKQQITR